MMHLPKPTDAMELNSVILEVNRKRFSNTLRITGPDSSTSGIVWQIKLDNYAISQMLFYMVGTNEIWCTRVRLHPWPTWASMVYRNEVCRRMGMVIPPDNTFKEDCEDPQVYRATPAILRVL